MSISIWMRTFIQSLIRGAQEWRILSRQIALLKMFCGSSPGRTTSNRV